MTETALIRATETELLARIDAGKAALEAAFSVDEVKQLRDGAAAIQAWCKQRGYQFGVQNAAAEWKIRSERRLGELLRPIVRAGNPQFRHDAGNGGRIPDGISEDESRRWQLLAKLPEERFAAYIATQNAEGEEITSADVLKMAKGGTLLKRKQDAADSPDDFQTPDWAIDVIAPYLSSDWRIWEPAAGKGNLVNGLRRRGFRVDGSDILTGADFLTTDHPHPYDAVVTNPPYSLKDDFLRRCYDLGKPFALLMPAGALFERERMALYRKHGVHVLAPDRRINFETPSGRADGESSAWFFSAWFTWGFDVPADASAAQVVFWEPSDE